MMKLTRLPFFLLPFLFLLSIPFRGEATKFEAGGEVKVTDAGSGDLYVAGGEVHVEDEVSADLLVAGGKVIVKKDVGEDMMISAGEAELRGNVGDDLRVFGGQVRIEGEVEGDLLVFGGDISIGSGALVKGMLKVYGGELELDGRVEGDVEITGGNFSHDGTIDGDLLVRTGNARLAGTVAGKSILASRVLHVEEGARFQDDVQYWRRKGEMDLSPFMSGGEAVLDPALKDRVMGDVGWGVMIFGFTLFWIIYILSAALILFLLNFFLTRSFKRAGIAMEHLTKSLGYGALYVFGMPIASLILLITVIGAPIALVTGSIWGLSMLFTHLLAATVITHWIKVHYNKGWDRTYLFLVSLLLYVVIKALAMIPILGQLFSLFLVMASFGALILARRTLFSNRPMVRL